MIVLFTIPIFCFDINHALTNTSIEDKSESFVRNYNKGFNEKHEILEKKDQEGQLSESSTTTERGEKEIGKERRIRAYDVQIDKAKLEGKEKVKAKVKVKVKAANSDRKKYNFKPSGIGNSWLIGTDDDSSSFSNYANAFPNGVSDCPVNLTIPSNLTDEHGQTKKVEIIGQYAFYACACYTNCPEKGKTKKLTLTRQVKVIKNSGLGYMDDLVEFVLEEGSVLETIETHGLYDIGYSLVGSNNEGKRVTLTLPSTLSSVFKDGICVCNLFNVIIYCGSNPLTNSSYLEEDISDTKLKVSSEYPSGENIFGRSPDRNSQKEVEASCSKMEVRPILKPSNNCPFNSHSLCLLSLFSTLLPSHSISSRALFLNLA